MVWSKTVVWSAWTILHRNFILWPSNLINRTPSSGRLFFLPRIGLLGPRDAAPGKGSGPDLPSSPFLPAGAPSTDGRNCSKNSGFNIGGDGVRLGGSCDEV